MFLSAFIPSFDEISMASRSNNENIELSNISQVEISYLTPLIEHVSWKKTIQSSKKFGVFGD